MLTLPLLQQKGGLRAYRVLQACMRVCLCPAVTNVQHLTVTYLNVSVCHDQQVVWLPAGKVKSLVVGLLSGSVNTTTRQVALLLRNCAV